METLNEVFSSLSMRRRYEVWFVRVGLADGSGAWWFRCLLMNPGRAGCQGNPAGMPAQVWATWFPRDAKPASFIQGFPLSDLDLSAPGGSPFHFHVGSNRIDENSCQGSLHVDGHKVAWNLRYRSTFRVTLSNKGWIGFSRSPHSDALFSGRITLDGQTFEGEPLGYGVQGHNCGYRHRSFWTWAHAYFAQSSGAASTLEALIYDMPFGLVFRKAVLWHRGQQYQFRNLRESPTKLSQFAWNFHCSNKVGLQLRAAFDGTGCSIHPVPYLKTNCLGTFAVQNNSLARSYVHLQHLDGSVEYLNTDTGAVLEKAGQQLSRETQT
jgi:hypothetical protein